MEQLVTLTVRKEREPTAVQRQILIRSRQIRTWLKGITSDGLYEITKRV
jgi:hypothetical protein